MCNTMAHGFRIHDQHIALAKGDGQLLMITCETCSLSFVTVKAIEFMLMHGVHRMVVDGCPIVQIY